MTIESIQELDGNVHGKVICANPSCRKVLWEWEGIENEPGPEDSWYLLFGVETRVLFLYKYGLPLQLVPSWQPHQAFDVDVLFNLGGRIVGYRVVPGSIPCLEDFGSDRCAVQFLAHVQQWGLCVRRQPDGMNVFVADAPDRFTTLQVRVNLP